MTLQRGIENAVLRCVLAGFSVSQAALGIHMIVEQVAAKLETEGGLERLLAERTSELPSDKQDPNGSA